MNVVIIDDDALDASLLEAYVSESPDMELSALFTSPLQGMDYLNQHRVDLLLLDHEMPDLSGICLAKSLIQPPPIVMVTSYPAVAAEGFEIDLVDFLVKPVTFERFLKAISKVRRRQAFLIGTTAVSDQKPQANAAPTEEAFVSFKSGREVHRIALKEIVFLEASGNYVEVHLRGAKKVLVQQPLQELLQSLPGNSFIRTHRSFAINLAHVSKLERHQLWLGEKVVPLGRTYKKQVDALLS